MPDSPIEHRSPSQWGRNILLSANTVSPAVVLNFPRVVFPLSWTESRSIQ